MFLKSMAGNLFFNHNYENLYILFHYISIYIVAKEDYTSTSYSLVFIPDNERAQQCRAVNILSDDNLEGTETFMTTLATTDDRVSLNPDNEAIFIVDNDG